MFLISIGISIFSINDVMFIFSRFLQGITSAALAISIYVMIVEEYEDSKVGSALGLISSAGYVGMLVAPSFMGFMIYLVDWKAAFLILIPIIAILLFCLYKIDHEWITEKKPVDNIGSIIYAVAMILFTYGMTELENNGIIFLIISIILAIIFIKVEKKVQDPIFNFNLVKNVKYVIGNYAAMATYFTTTIAITALTFHLEYVLNTSEYIVGIILMISPIIMIGMSGLAGKISNTVDARIISGIAMIFLFISMSMFFVMDRLPIQAILLACGLQGIGNGLFSAPNNKYVLTLVDEKDLPNASSVLSTSKEFGKILSNGIFSLLLAIYIGNQSLGADYPNPLLIQATNIMMLICMIVTFSATILLFYSKYGIDRSPN